MAYRIDIPKTGQVFTALTIDSACIPAQRSLNKYTGVTVGNQWDEIINGPHVVLDNTYLKLESTTNSTGAVREGYGLVMYEINGQRCENILHVVQAGSTPTSYNFKLAIKNDSSYITDFTDITLTVYSPTPQTITILNDLSGIPAGTTSQEISYTASTEGNTVACVCVVKNNKYPGGEIRTIPCYGFCDVAGGETVTFRYDDSV